MSLAPSVHGAGDKGFVPMMIDIARAKGFAAYVGDGTNRWPAIHRLDAAVLYRLALESAPAGSRLLGAGDEGFRSARSPRLSDGIWTCRRAASPLKKLPPISAFWVPSRHWTLRVCTTRRKRAVQRESFWAGKRSTRDCWPISKQGIICVIRIRPPLVNRGTTSTSSSEAAYDAAFSRVCIAFG